MKKTIRGFIFMGIMLMLICAHTYASEDDGKVLKTGKTLRVVENPILRVQIPSDYSSEKLTPKFYIKGSEQSIGGYYKIGDDGFCTIVPEESLKKGETYNLVLFGENRRLAVKEIMVENKPLLEEPLKDEIDIKGIIEDYTFKVVQKEKKVYNGWHYYIKYPKASQEDYGRSMLWKRDEESGEEQYLNSSNVDKICYIDDDWCYVEKITSGENSRSFYMVKIDGSREVRLGEGRSIFIGVEDDIIYFMQIGKEGYGQLKAARLGDEGANIFADKIYMRNAVDMNIKLRNNHMVLEYIKEENMIGLEEVHKKESVTPKYIEKEFGYKQEESIPINWGDKLELCSNLIKEDENYIYYHNGELYSFKGKAGSELYQKTFHRIYRKDKKTGLAEVVARNVVFTLPDYLVYTNYKDVKDDIDKDTKRVDLGKVECDDIYEVVSEIQKTMLMYHDMGQEYKLLVKCNYSPVYKNTTVCFIDGMLADMQRDMNLKHSIFREGLQFKSMFSEDGKSIWINYAWDGAEDFFQSFQKKYHGGEEDYLKYENIADPIIREHIKAITRVKHGNFTQGISREELNDIESLVIRDYTEKAQVDFDSLKHLRNLRDLQVIGFTKGRMKNMDVIGEIRLLKVLRIEGSGIEDILFLKKAKGLNELYLGNNEISDIEILRGFVYLRVIELQNNNLTDLSPLKNLIKLRKINVWGMDVKIADIRNLLHNLEEVHIQSK